MALPLATETETREISNLEQELQDVLQDHRVFYNCRAALARKGYILLSDFVEMYDDRADVKAKAPKDLGYGPANPDAPTEAETERVRLLNARMAQAWDTACIRLSARKQARAKAGSSSSGINASNAYLLISDTDRTAMRQLWADRHEDVMPTLDTEGSQTFFGIVQTQLNTKSWGLFTNKKAVSRSVEHVQRTTLTVKDLEGVHRDEAQERELMEAVNMEELHDRVEVIITTTMMVIYTMPHKPEVQIKEAELRKPFVHLFGKECLGRYPWVTASFASMLLDKVLRRIADMQLNRHLCLKASTENIVDDANFWFLNLYATMERVGEQPWSHTSNYQAPRPNASDRNRAQPYPSTPSKGKGKKGKGHKNKGSGYQSQAETTRTGMPVPAWQTPPQDWGLCAKRGPPKPPHYPGGQSICFNFHSQAGCRGGCTRDHDHCPRLLKDNSYCFGHHTRMDCRKH